MNPITQDIQIDIGPQRGQQEKFLVRSQRVDITGYGGAAGGGKTYGLLLAPLYHRENPLFGAVIFRRTNEDIRNEGGLWDTSQKIYGYLDCKPREANLDWRFESGATVSFSGMQYESDVLNWQGSQICLLGFDELTHFTQKQFFYMLSRNRSVCGVKPYVLCTFNPDPGSWVFTLFGPWVNPEHPLYPAAEGEVLWFVREDNEIIWVPEPAQRGMCNNGTGGGKCLTEGCKQCFPPEKSITFIPATVFDNPILLSTNPEYVSNLQALDEQDKQRLLYGKWTSIENKNALWSKYQIDRDRVQCAPPLARIVVAVDPATSSSVTADETGIVVVGQGRDDKQFYTLEDLSGHYTPHDWATVAVNALTRWNGACIVAEKNQGGEMVEHTIHTVKWVPVKLVHAKVGKKLRAEPVAAAAQAGHDHHVGTFLKLEGQMTRWVPGETSDSPDRLDAKVYAILELDPTLGEPIIAGVSTTVMTDMTPKIRPVGTGTIDGGGRLRPQRNVAVYDIFGTR